MKVLYSRVSTLNQNASRQHHNKTYDLLIQDKCSGAIPFFDRPNGKRLMEMISNDSISSFHIHSIDRLGRSLLNILETMKVLHENGIPIVISDLGLTTLVDGKVSATTQMIVSLLGTISELNRENIRIRILEGVEIGKLKGKYLGRQKGSHESIDKFLLKPKSKKIKTFIDKGYSIREITSIVNCSPNTVLKVKKCL